jgi:chaperonin cofactor prefoldin
MKMLLKAVANIEEKVETQIGIGDVLAVVKEQKRLDQINEKRENIGKKHDAIKNKYDSYFHINIL